VHVLPHRDNGDFGDSGRLRSRVHPRVLHRGLQDPLITQIGYTILSELQTPTTYGNLVIESLASTLVVRLIQRHLTESPADRSALLATTGPDRRRLRRVLHHIEANLEYDISVDALASVASLSRFHFARAFKAAIGQSPHQYVSTRRLERAKALLLRDDRSLADIAFALNFSSQANLTRAFRKHTGKPPGVYRAGGRRRHRDLQCSPDAARRRIIADGGG